MFQFSQSLRASETFLGLKLESYWIAAGDIAMALMISKFFLSFSELIDL